MNNFEAGDKFFYDWTQKIENIKNEKDFFNLCLEALRFQYERCEVFQRWCNLLNYKIESITNYNEIPFLPISFFKTHRVTCFDNLQEEDYFLSSGTGSLIRSKHLVYNKDFYLENTVSCFSQFFSDLEDYSFICLLPNYIEQGHSSLICMTDYFIRKSKHKTSGFYSHDLQSVIAALEYNKEHNIKTILFGVTYALLDLAENYETNLKDTVIFETGGMKGRRKEMTKEEVHKILKKRLNVQNIASEYGMCELFSQAYSRGGGVFKTPKQMKTIIKEVNDYRHSLPQKRTGVINIIDLANISTCCFIQTQDLGKKTEDGDFEIMGRLDYSDIRGCNLMY
ncbi:MAG: acyltransferase [Bacteroidales bacterium]|nr:acyltransferase [Bacteroidales bacterium]